MPTRIAVLLLLFATMGPGRAEPKKPPDRPIDQIGAELHTLIEFEELDDPKATLRDVLNQLRTKYKAKVGFDYNDKAFKEAYGATTKDIRDEIIGKLEANNLTLEGLLRRVLGKIPIGGGGASFMLRDGVIEITTEDAIRRELKLPTPLKDHPPEPPLPVMIPYMKFDGDTLEAACEKIGERAGITILIDPRVKEKANAAIKARLVNIPLDVAIDLLADMAGLAAARKANAVYITTPENAEKLKPRPAVVIPSPRPLEFFPAVPAIRAEFSADLSKLPAPEKAFGLELTGPATEAGLKGLARFKHLAALSLRDTGLPDAALKELAPLTGLIQLDLRGTKAADEGLEALAPLKKLTSLRLPEITDVGLRSLRRAGLLHTLAEARAAGGGRPAGPEDVELLDLSGTKVTGRGLKELAPFTRLASLDLRDGQLNDDGLDGLAALKHLTHLDLRDTRVSDDGMKALARLKQLRTLNLKGTLVTDAGLKHLATLAQLTSLDLTFLKVTGAGLKHLAPLEHLDTLALFGTELTNEGLKELAALKRLTSLTAGGTKVTDAGIEALQKALPGCRIVR